MAALFKIALYLLAVAASVSAQPVDSVLVWESMPLTEEYSIGSFQRATRVVVRRQNWLCVLDADENKLSLFSNPQDSPKTIGGFGWSAGSFDKPTGVATDGVHVYVSDFGNHRIQRFDRNLNYVSSFSTRDTSNAACRFGYPIDIALSDLGDMFVLDGENLRALKFNSQYFFERSIGDINAGKGKLQNPIKILVTTSSIFIGERTRIVIFDYFGNYMNSIGNGVVSDLNGFTLLEDGFLAASSDTLWWFSQDGILQKSMPLSHLISGDRIDRIQDVASNGDKLFILSPNRLHVFKMSN